MAIGEKYKEFLKLSNEHGRVRALGIVFLEWVPRLILVLVPAVVSILLVNKNTSEKISRLESTVSSSINTIVNVSDNANSQDNKKLEGNKEEVKGDNSSFNPDQWLASDKFTIDKEGYYCNNKIKEYDYWYMWSPEKFSANFYPNSFEIKFKLKSGQAEIPTVSIVYGEYNEKYKSIGDIVYRLNLFDEDSKNLRLYDKNNNVPNNSQARLKTEPNLNEEISLELRQRTNGNDESQIMLIPKISYYSTENEANKRDDFKPDREFILPTKILEVESVRKQLGIGVRTGGCIKITEAGMEKSTF